VRPDLLEGTWIAEPFLDLHYDSNNPIEVIDGHFSFPRVPAWGVVPDEQFIGEPVLTIT